MTLVAFTPLSWLLALGPAAALGVALLAILNRRRLMHEYAHTHKERTRAKETGSHEARLQHPDIDLAKCIGCGSCIRACPEDGVLALLHGQAVVVHGARCVGHGLCAAACPTAAIDLTLGDLSQRHDLPALTTEFEAVNMPGLFLAGEITGFSLVRTAVSHGIAAADAIARNVASPRRTAARTRPMALTVGGKPVGTAVLESPTPELGSGEVLDLLVVGTGPGGMACSLRAKERGLNFLTIDQEPRIGGTIAAYPRHKLVMTQPLDLPLFGRLPELQYQKEDLIHVWEQVTQSQQLPIRLGTKLEDLKRDDDGVFIAKTSNGEIRARHVCLALGRRGSPRRLGIPGEDLPKVSYSLLDAESYQGRRVLVVGGGDSAVEASLGLAEQPGNQVTIAYRKEAFFRLKARNDSRIQRAIIDHTLKVLFSCEVTTIEEKHAQLRLADGVEHRIENDDVFIFAGGDPPFALLERAGISFDPKDRPPPPEVAEKNNTLLKALSMAFLCAVVLSIWGIWFASYYQSDLRSRAGTPEHWLLRPGGPVGLWCAIVGCVLFVWNLAYLIRRSIKVGRYLPGSLKGWMGAHIFTGLFALLCILVHSGFSTKTTVGGHALLALGIVVATGLIGRYLYAFIPRAANGTESSLDDLRFQLAALSADWDRDGRGFGMRVREHVDHLVTDARWRPGFLARLRVLFTGQFKLRRAMHNLKVHGSSEGIPSEEVRRVLMLARRAYRLTLLVTHYEEIRAVLASWRYFHRWLGLLMVLLAVAHIITALRYAHLDLGLQALRGGSP